MNRQLSFVQLNIGWNADPNAPEPTVELRRTDLYLRFFLNHYQFANYSQDDIGEICFSKCSRYHLGGTNDEGWYAGQCRFGRRAKNWGEFYEILGKDPLLDGPANWVFTGLTEDRPRHFLFYLRDAAFECVAEDWSFSDVSRT